MCRGGTGDDSAREDIGGDYRLDSDYAVKRAQAGTQKKGQGAMPLAGSRDSVPCGGWGNAPTVFRALNFKEAANKGAGSEASLPVTSRFLRSAPKLLFPTSVLCRAKWARPTCLSFRHSNSFPQAGDFASAEVTKGQWKRTKSAIALWKPSVPQLFGLSVA